MFGKTHTLFRPPGEADSLIIRVADGCPWNGCTFCGMYKGVKYSFPAGPRRSSKSEGRAGLDVIEEIFSKHWKNWPDARRIFLADGDVMHLSFQTLEKMLVSINHTFKGVTRISVYAGGTSILNKTDEQLRRLKELKLNTLYMGLESGDNETLKAVNKQETAEEMIEAGQRAQEAGLRMSVMVLIGLAGELRSFQHAQATAQALNAMQPRLLSALRLVTTPNTPLYKNGFEMVTEFEAVTETREMISHLELESTVFRADHSSNIVPLEARFPKDKQRLLNQLDALLAFQPSPEATADTAGLRPLDKTSPGRLPWSL